MVELSIIIVSYNSYDDIKTNINSIIEKIKAFTYEVIIVNNFINDEKVNEFEMQNSFVKIIHAGSNLGFSKANNLGLQYAKGKYILFLNPDVILLSDIDKLVERIDNNPNIGLIGPLTRRADMTILPSCGQFPTIKNWISYNFFLNKIFPKVKVWGNYAMKHFSFKGLEEVDWISGAFILGKKDLITDIGGFDERFFMYGEDVDICWKIHKRDLKVVFSDEASIIHTVGHSVKKRSINKAKLMVNGFYILWMKYYRKSDVKSLLRILYIGSIIRKIAWKLVNIVKRDKDNGSIEYYSTVIDETLKYYKNIQTSL